MQNINNIHLQNKNNIYIYIIYVYKIKYNINDSYIVNINKYK